jgi:carbon monoxide dehydrogenase subunit G
MIGLFSPSEARTEVAVTPEVVWAVISDPRTYPDWLVGAQRIRAVDPAFPAPGTEFHHSVGATEEATIDDTTQATHADPPFRLGLEVHAGPFEADVELLVLPSPEGSEIRFRERPKGGWIALTPVLRPFLHARNAASLRRLRGLLDGATPAEAGKRPRGRRVGRSGTGAGLAVLA